MTEATWRWLLRKWGCLQGQLLCLWLFTLQKQQTFSKPTKTLHQEADLSRWPPKMGHLWTNTGPK